MLIVILKHLSLENGNSTEEKFNKDIPKILIVLSQGKALRKMLMKGSFIGQGFGSRTAWELPHAQGAAGRCGLKEAHGELVQE